jgi:hypothetical protein
LDKDMAREVLSKLALAGGRAGDTIRAIELLGKMEGWEAPKRSESKVVVGMEGVAEELERRRERALAGAITVEGRLLEA